MSSGLLAKNSAWSMDFSRASVDASRDFKDYNQDAVAKTQDFFENKIELGERAPKPVRGQRFYRAQNP